MLQRIRDNASGPLAYVVVAVITLVFGVWGIGSYFTPSSDPVIASVGSTEITQGQLQRAYEQRYQRLRDLMGDNFDPSVLRPEQLRRNVLQSLIDGEVLDQYAREAGYRVSDAQLLGAIRNNPQFQRDGEFSQQRYLGLLSQAGVAPARYEQSLRDDLISRELRMALTQSAFAAPAEVDQAYRLANQQRALSYLRFAPADYLDQVEISDAQIQAYYRENGDAFQRPERVRVAYVSLTPATQAQQPGAIDEQTLRGLYAQNKGKFGEPERRSGALIRVPIEGDGSAARETIQQLAAAEGDLQSRAANAPGVEYRRLDAVERSALQQAPAEALFGLEAGETSAPVKGENAWYLVSLEGVEGATTPAFDDPQVQAQLKSMANAEQSEQAYRDKRKRLEALAFEAPNDLKTLANELGLEVQTSDWITREGGPGIGQYDAVRKAAFSDAVLKDELNSTPIQLGADRQIVLRIEAHEPPEQRPLGDVRDRIREQLKQRKASELAQEAAQTALERLQAQNGEATLESVAAQSSAELQSPGFVRRSNREIDPRVREALFSLPQPAEGEARYTVTPTTDGQVALVALQGLRETPKQEGAVPRSQFASQQRNYISDLEYAVLSDYLRSQVDVEINTARLN